MKASVLNHYNQIDWQTVADPICQPDEVIVKVSYASICGSDQHIFKGEFHPRTQLPMIPGHEFAGVIVETGSEITRFAKGEQVAVDPIIWCGKCPACLIGHFPACTSLKLIGIDMNGGFSEYVAVKENMLFKVRNDIPAKHAALVEILAIGFHACNRSKLKSGDTLAIFGAGKVGQSILQAASTKTQNTIFLVDVLDQRLERAVAAYPDIIPINIRQVDPLEKIRELTNGKGVDIAIEAVGHAHEVEGRFNPVRSCVKSIRGAGVVCVLGLGDEPSPVLMKELIWKEGYIVASRVSHGEFSEVIAHLEKGDLKPEVLITDILPAQDAQHGFELLETEPANHLKVLLEF